MRHHCLTLSVCATLIVGLMADARACSIPVFRFALERWQADFYEVAVFHRGELTGSELQHVDRLEEAAVRNGGAANFEVVRCDVSGTVPPDLGKVLQSLGDVPLPQVVVRRPREGARQPELWRGRLSDLDVARFVDSPARRELSRRLLGGDAVVWLLVRGSDAKVADALRQSRLDADSLAGGDGVAARHRGSGVGTAFQRAASTEVLGARSQSCRGR